MSRKASPKKPATIRQYHDDQWGMTKHNTVWVLLWDDEGKTGNFKRLGKLVKAGYTARFRAANQGNCTASLVVTVTDPNGEGQSMYNLSEEKYHNFSEPPLNKHGWKNCDKLTQLYLQRPTVSKMRKGGWIRSYISTEVDDTDNDENDAADSSIDLGNAPLPGTPKTPAAFGGTGGATDAEAFRKKNFPDALDAMEKAEQTLEDTQLNLLLSQTNQG